MTHYTITIHKVGDDGSDLAGAIFDVVSNSTGVSVGQITTDANGLGSLTGLPDEAYTITEIQAPAGYVALLLTAVLEPTDFDETRTAYLTVINHKENPELPAPTGAIMLYKHDAQGGALAGAVFDVIRVSTSDSIGHIVTGSNGSGFMDYLPLEAYTVQEIQAPDGYVLDTRITSISMVDFEEFPVVTVTAINRQAPRNAYTIVVHKTNEQGGVLAGAVFDVLSDATGAKVGTITTDATGSASLTGLDAGAYTLVETKAPDGYALYGSDIKVAEEDFDEAQTATVGIVNTLERPPTPPAPPPSPTSRTTLPETGNSASVLEAAIALSAWLLGVAILLYRRKLGNT